MGSLDLRKSAIAETDKQSSTYIDLEGAAAQKEKETVTPTILSHRDSLGISKVRPRTVKSFSFFNHLNGK